MTHTHGAASEAKIAPLARNHRRRIMRQLALSPRDLDAPARGYLQLYVRTAAKIDVLDSWFSENEFVRADGTVTPAAQLYPTLVNTAARVLARLEEHVEKVERDPFAKYRVVDAVENGDGD